MTVRSWSERYRECERAEGIILRQLARKLRRAVAEDPAILGAVRASEILDVASELAAVALIKVGPDIAGEEDR